MDTTMGDTTAPHEVWHRPFVQANEDWCDAFVLELRLLDVPGPVIGERLAEVEAHCTDAGESPAAAFGAPVDYARRLDEQRSPELVSGVWRTTVSSAVQVLALAVGTSAAFAWSQDEQLSYNLVQVGAMVLLMAVVLALPLLLRRILERPWTVGLPVLALAIGAGAGVAAAGQLDLRAVLTVPPATVTVALFVLVVVLAVVEHLERSRDGEADLVTSPLPPATQAPTSQERRRRLASLLPSALIPASYVVLSAVPWILP